MATIDTQTRASNTDFMILPTDVYRMKILKAAMEEDQFADSNPDGIKPYRLVLTWEVSELLPEQEDEAMIGQKVWQRLNPYYGPIRNGGVSKFKAFIDQLKGQGYLPNFNPRSFETDDLVGIEQRVSVEEYIKSQGVNAGQPGNKVVAVLPLRKPKAAKPEVKVGMEYPGKVKSQIEDPQPAETDDSEAIPF